MPNLLHILLRILAVIASALVLYVLVVVYEDAEKRIQNRLEEVWVRIDDLQSSAVSKEAAFVNVIARVSGSFFDRIFGHRLISLRSIAICLAFTFASGDLAIALIYLWGGGSNTFALMIGLLMLVLGSLPVLASANVPAPDARGRRLRHRGRPKFAFLAIFRSKAYYYGIIIVSICILWIGEIRIPTTTAYDIGWNIFDFTASVAVDLAFIMFFRWVFRRLSAPSSFWQISVYLILVSAVTALLMGPFLLIAVPYLRNHFRLLYQILEFSGQSSTDVMLNLRISTFVISENSLLNGACLFIVVILMVLLMVHRLLWPSIKRPLYAVQRYHVVTKKKLLGAVAGMLLLYVFRIIPLSNG
jgi:hypothetical protein